MVMIATKIVLLSEMNCPYLGRYYNELSLSEVLKRYNKIVRDRCTRAKPLCGGKS
jgi:hypothetical protein